LINLQAVNSSYKPNSLTGLCGLLRSSVYILLYFLIYFYFSCVAVWTPANFWAIATFLRIEMYWFNVNRLSNHGHFVD